MDLVQKVHIMHIMMSLVLACCFLFCIGYAFFGLLPLDDNKKFFMDVDPLPDEVILKAAGIERLKDIFGEKSLRRDGKNIFFVDVNLRAEVDIPMVAMSPRLACALESAAYRNPDMDVYLLHTRPTYENVWQQDSLLNALRSYPNLHFRNFNMTAAAEGTPSEQFLKNGDLYKSNFIQEHATVFVSFLSLWHFGGVYMDKDVIVLKNLSELPPNFVGVQRYLIGKDVIGFQSQNVTQKNPSSNVVEKCLIDFQESLYNDCRMRIGYETIYRIVRAVCDDQRIDVILMRDSDSCHGVYVFNSKAFYPIDGHDWKDLFTKELLKYVMSKLKYSYVLRMWDGYSNNYPIIVDTNNAFGVLVQQNCPKTFAAAKNHF